MQADTNRRFEHMAKSIDVLTGDVARLAGVIQAREDKFGDLLAAMDGYVLRAEHTAADVAGLERRTDVLEKWVTAIGRKTGVTLNVVEP
ncbi:hypothetical protein KBI5_23605 [Frankia sp. KB5]|nr:hypothetical protein KBI5_23605 [Frankia sp. KB5]